MVTRSVAPSVRWSLVELLPELQGFDPNNRVAAWVEPRATVEHLDAYRVFLDAVLVTNQGVPDDVFEESTQAGATSQAGCSIALSRGQVRRHLSALIPPTTYPPRISHGDSQPVRPINPK